MDLGTTFGYLLVAFAVALYLYFWWWPWLLLEYATIKCIFILKRGIRRNKREGDIVSAKVLEKVLEGFYIELKNNKLINTQENEESSR